MSTVFGSSERPAYSVMRTDGQGRPISIGDELPVSNAILYAGPPGMGKTSELNQAADVAKRNGYLTVRLAASQNVSIEHHITNAILAELPELEKEYGKRRLRKVRKTVSDLTRSGRKSRWGWEGRVPLGIGPLNIGQGVFKQEFDTTPYDQLGTTLTDLAGELGRTAGGKPVLLLIDDVDQGSDRDLAGLNELAIHLEQSGLPVWLIAAGGAKSTTMMMAASRRMSGIASTFTNQFSVRKVGPLSDAELRPAITEPLRRAGMPYQREAIDRLVRAANGSPYRLRGFALAAEALADARTGITVDVAAAAIVKVENVEELQYESRLNECGDAERELLATVAEQDPNGLFMPAVLQAAGQDKWQEIDGARQELVARGLVREHGEYVTIAEPHLREYIRAPWLEGDPTGPDPAGPEQFFRQLAKPDAGLAPIHPTADPTRINQILGTAGNPRHRLDRTSADGVPLSLDERPPTRTTILFEGPPGVGTSQELSRTKAMADEEGWTTIRLDASPREPLEFRVIRAVNEQLDSIRENFGDAEAKHVKKLLSQLSLRTRNTMNTAQIRLGPSGGPQFGLHKSFEGVQADNVGVGLPEVADYLGQLAAAKRLPVLFMIDNLDAATDDDMASLSTFSKHLDEARKPVFLIAAGGEQAVTRLRTASGGKSKVATTTPLKMDLRKVPLWTEDELRPALAEPLQQAEIEHEPAAIDKLVKEANGNPARLRALAGSALELVAPDSGSVTVTVANAASARLNARSDLLYDAAWYNCTPLQKELLVKTAASGRQGLLRPAKERVRDESTWPRDRAAQDLLSDGLLARSGKHHIIVADPGFQDWVQIRLGLDAAQAGIARPAGPQAQVASTGERSAPSRPALGPGGSTRDLQANR
ncbi:hypothetical protein OHA18_14905 [Kribbella sp. NBC_00709]|uniref:hypothetical protein n=1 Tax=Kribbella sp. NBC_00709 TaxID=2975972 RepID=UPI002E293707|nr:hypothetical protein [Kribbella sp. NBC_00709]